MTTTTEPTLRGPVRVRDVLRPARRGPDAAGAAALRGAGRANRWRAGATGALIAAEAIKALDEDLGALLVWTLEKSTALAEAGEQSRADPDTPQYVDLTQVHAVESPPVRATLDVYVERLHRATLTVVLKAEFGLLGVRLVVQNGWVTGVDGQQSVTASVTVESVQVTGGERVPLDCTLVERGRETEWAPVPLSYPVPLRGGGERSASAAG